MNGLRKCFLLASLGCVSGIEASAQTPTPRPDGAGVVLCRPQPLLEAAPPPAAPPSSPIPAFVIRGQMADGPDRSLPSADDIAVPRVKPWTPVPPTALSTPAKSATKPATPFSRYTIRTTTMTVPQPQTPLPSPDGSKTFNPPPPTPAVTQPPYNVWTGPIAGLLAGTAPVVAYDTANWNKYGPAVPAFYARAEYLLWWTNGYHLPVLVTTGPATTPENSLGVLGQPGTQVLYGGNNTNYGPVSGARFMMGYNFDPCGLCGIDGGYFFLAQNNDNFFASNAVLARPFFNVNTGMQDRELTSSPGALPTDFFKLRGTIAVDNFSNLQGAELNWRTLLCSNCNYFLYGFAGFRYLDLNEGLNITENVVSAAAVPGFSIFAPGNQIIVNDSFGTQNRFYGGQLGLDGEWRVSGGWFVGGRAQVALGVTHETININGSQTITTLAGATSTYTGGLLALPSNIGSISQNRFSVVPQIGVRIGYAVTPNLRVFVGYDFLYWSNVVRPGNQVDTNLNVSQIPNFTPAGGAFAPPSHVVAPVVPFTTSSFYAQGVSVGLEWRY